MQLVAATAFGLEAVVARELPALGLEKGDGIDGRVVFAGDERDLIRANLYLRAAERVAVLIGRFPAKDFDALFEQTKDLPWEDWLPSDAEFPVSGNSVRSGLSSVPAVQRSVKKAIVERLRKAHRVSELPETGPRFPIEVSLRNDEAWLLLDTSGHGLHKRGYRTFKVDAPLRETVAAAMLLLSYWRPGRVLVDPFCGSGTIPIEAALIARNRAPGIGRTFVSETWPRLPGAMWEAVRAEARQAETAPQGDLIQGYDIDGRSINLSRRHADQAGVADDIHFQKREFSAFSTTRKFGVMLANPPYGERLGERTEAEEITAAIGHVMAQHDTWSFGFLSAIEFFEKLADRKADKRRKLYNGPLKCMYHQFHGPKPPPR